MFSRDDDGRWLTTAHGYQGSEPSAITDVAHSIGEGAYEGLSAMVTCEQALGSAKWACDGIIFEGEWPELPAEAPEEVPAIHLAP